MHIIKLGTLRRPQNLKKHLTLVMAFIQPKRVGDFFKFLSPLLRCRGATATKASKARALPKFWVTVNPISTRGQIIPTTVLWALSGSKLPWRAPDEPDIIVP